MQEYVNTQSWVVVIMNHILPPAAQRHHSGVEHKNLTLRDIPFDTLTLHYGAQFKGDMSCDKLAVASVWTPFNAELRSNERTESKLYLSPINRPTACRTTGPWKTHKKSTKKQKQMSGPSGINHRNKYLQLKLINQALCLPLMKVRVATQTDAHKWWECKKVSTNIQITLRFG